MSPDPDRTAPCEHLPFFVYGTLKRGEIRESMWPRPAAHVEPATTCGRLFDLGPYPALLDGDGEIAGELWHVSPADFRVTLATLDRIECYGVDEVDLYVRRIVTCRTQSGLRRAYAYFLADARSVEHLAEVRPEADGLRRWGR